ncbi:MAG TPA: response regulator [Thermoanaerobaculia bacterium]
MSPTLVAVVDDEESVRRAFRRLLLAAGMDVETFASGQEFLASLQTRRPDCAVLDLSLPGLTGLDVLERLAAAGVRVPIVMVSGHDQPGIAELALAAGVAAYLRKPLDDESLLNAVASAVRAASRAAEHGTKVPLFRALDDS